LTISYKDNVVCNCRHLW